jgi:hypothetical protein
MRPRSWVTFILGVFLTAMGIVSLVISGSAGGTIPLLIGGSLCYLGWRGGRTALLVFGHTTIVIGCAMITWGIYLLPYSKPTLTHVLSFPLFWGFISLFGGICANYHGFCQCIRGPK